MIGSLQMRIQYVFVCRCHTTDFARHQRQALPTRTVERTLYALHWYDVMPPVTSIFPVSSCCLHNCVVCFIGNKQNLGPKCQQYTRNVRQLHMCGIHSPTTRWVLLLSNANSTINVAIIADEWFNLNPRSSLQ